MQTIPCVPCSSSPIAVNIPGAQGATGPYPITTTTANFTIPSSGQSVTVSVVTTAPFVQNQNVFVGGANFLVSAINSTTSVTLIALGSTNDATGTVVSGTTVVSGVGNFLAETIQCIVTVGFTIPAIGAAVNVTVNNTSQTAVGQNVFVGGANFLVSSVTPSTSLTVVFLSFPGDAASGSGISSGTPVLTCNGNLKAAATKTLITTGAFTIPLAGATGVCNVLDGAPFLVGQNVSITDGTNVANFLVSAASSNTLTLFALGFPNDAKNPTTFAAGTSVIIGSAKLLAQQVVLDDPGGTFNNFSNNTATQIPHGIYGPTGAIRIPSQVRVVMRCVTADTNSGYGSTDEISLDRITGSTQSFQPLGWYVDAYAIHLINNGVGAGTPYKIVVAAGTGSVSFNDGTGGSANMANFQLRAYLNY